MAQFLAAEEIKTKFIESDDILRSLISSKVEEVGNSLVLESFKEEYLEDPISMGGETPMGGEDNETPIKQEKDTSIEDGEQELLIIEKLEPAQDEEVVETPKPKKKRKRPYIARPLPDISKQFSCDTCLQLIPKKREYERHIKKHKENNDLPAHTCQTCDQKFYKSSSFINHKCTVKTVCWICQPPQKFSTKRQVQVSNRSW